MITSIEIRTCDYIYEIKARHTCVRHQSASGYVSTTTNNSTQSVIIVCDNSMVDL